MDLSIILPVYNVEPYIERCIRSLSIQDIDTKDYEIIVVNDGSPDHSRDIVIELQKEIENLILIDQENQGVSMARNKGLENAKGNYVLFIDPDDYVVQNSLSSFLQKAIDDELEVLYMGFEEWSLDGAYSGKVDYKELNGKIVSGIDTYRATRDKKSISTDRPVAILFNRDFLGKNRLKYTKNIPFLEDGHFVGKVLCIATRCGFNDDPFYLCEKRPGSATTTLQRTDFKKTDGFLIAANDLKKFETSYEFNSDQLELVNHLIAKFALTAVTSAVSSRKPRSILFVKKQLKKNGIKYLNMKGLKVLKTYAVIYNLSFWSFVAYYIIESRFKLIKMKFGKEF